MGFDNMVVPQIVYMLNGKASHEIHGMEAEDSQQSRTGPDSWHAAALLLAACVSNSKAPHFPFIMQQLCIHISAGVRMRTQSACDSPCSCMCHCLLPVPLIAEALLVLPRPL